MIKSSSQISTKEPNLTAPLLCRGMSAGLVCMVALFTVGGTIDTLAAGDDTTGLEFACGRSLCLGPSSEVTLVPGAAEGSFGEGDL